MTKHIGFSLALVIALVALTASNPTAFASSANVPTGIYTTTLVAADIPAEFPAEVAQILVGNWEIEITDAGSYIVNKDGFPVVVGRYNSNPARVIMTDLEGALSCTDQPGIATATYRWTFSGDDLLLTAVSDRCAGRNLVLTAHPLQKQ
jgi:hypothetical protein